jgi:hypothetical protein
MTLKGRLIKRPSDEYRRISSLVEHDVNNVSLAHTTGHLAADDAIQT